MNYEAWEKTVPEAFTKDPLWRMQVYRLALFIGDIGWVDVSKLAQDHRTLGLSNQLYRALGSIGANIAEGYSRNSGRDQARMYEYALGSAREARHWYYEGRHVLGEEVTAHRLDLLAQINRHLMVIVPAQRGHYLKEESAEYQITDGLEST